MPSMAQPSFYAIPDPNSQHSDWLQTMIERRAFELRWTIDHPRFGRVVHLPTPALISEYQRLLDEEQRAWEAFTDPQAALEQIEQTLHPGVAPPGVALQQEVNPAARSAT